MLAAALKDDGSGATGVTNADDVLRAAAGWPTVGGIGAETALPTSDAASGTRRPSVLDSVVVVVSLLNAGMTAALFVVNPAASHNQRHHHHHHHHHIICLMTSRKKP